MGQEKQSGLTDKEEAFAHAMAEGMGPSDAYRASRDCAKMATSTINANAKKLTRKKHIQARIEELRRESGVSDTDPITTRTGARARANPEASKAGKGSSPMADQVGGDALNGRDAASGRFRPRNHFWEARSSAGPQPRFADGEALWTACVKYFEWVEANPLNESQLITFQGAASEYPVTKMRPMTIRGLCRFLGIERRTWGEWRKDRPDLAPTIEKIDSVIYDQKFAGAAAGLLNANIIARELGLADKTELTGEGGGAVKVEDLTPKHPGHDHMEDMAQRFLGGLARHAPEVAAKLAETTGRPLNGAVANTRGPARRERSD